MSDLSFKIIPEQNSHAQAVEDLLDLAFGPGRFAKTAYRLREGADAVPGLSFAGFLDEELIATIRFWPVKIGTDTPALMLGPLAVDPTRRGKGWGLEMIEVGLTHAKVHGHHLVVLVGDEDYYARQGFKKVPPGQITMPGPCDPQRLLYCELDNDVMPVEGLISR
jgi:predicted N-acetyltransferase YhbS